MDTDLEQNQNQLESGEQVSKVEQVPKVSKEEAEVSGKTFTEAELGKLRGEWKEQLHRDWQSTKDKEFQSLKDQMERVKLEKAEAELKATEEKEYEELGDTAEVRNFQTQRRDLQNKIATLSEREAKALAKEAQLWEDAKLLGAHKTAKELDIDVNELLKANTPEEMQAIAKDLRIKTLEAKLAEKPAEIIDSGGTGTASQDWRGLSFEDGVKLALSKKK